MIVAERESSKRAPLVCVVENTRAALADLAAAFYDRPDAAAENGGRYRHERQDHDDVSAQAHLRESGIALRIDRDGALRNR